ncbi:hypothetical protein VP01_10721g1, partial [Puccinia sorghi]
DLPGVSPTGGIIFSLRTFVHSPPKSTPVSMATSSTLSVRVRPRKPSQFNIHAYNSAWSDNILVSLYCSGLKGNIQLAIFGFDKGAGEEFYQCGKKNCPSR